MKIHNSENPLLDGTNTLISADAKREDVLRECSTSLAEDAKMQVGDGSILIECDIRMAKDTKLFIGDYTRLRGVTISIPTPGCVVTIGNYCRFARDCRIHCDRSIIIGDFNLFAPGCFLTDSQIHHTDAELRKLEILNMCGHRHTIPLMRTAPLKIGSLCWFNTNSQVHVAKYPEMQMRIADKTIIAAGAIVKESIDIPDQMYAGVPAVHKGPAARALTKDQLRNLHS